MRTRGAQRPREFVVLQEVGEIWWATSMQSFEGQVGKFKPFKPNDCVNAYYRSGHIEAVCWCSSLRGRQLMQGVVAQCWSQWWMWLRQTISPVLPSRRHCCHRLPACVVETSRWWYRCVQVLILSHCQLVTRHQPLSSITQPSLQLVTSHPQPRTTHSSLPLVTRHQPPRTTHSSLQLVILTQHSTWYVMSTTFSVFFIASSH